MNEDVPLYLSAEAIRSCLSSDEVFSIVTETLRGLSSGQAVNGGKSGFGLKLDGQHVHVGSVSGAVLSSDAAGVKWFTVAPENPSLQLPRVPATIVISHTRTGLLKGVLDGTQLTAERTAAMAVAAALACTRRPPSKAAVVGAGFIGRAIIGYLATQSPVKVVEVVAPDDELATQALRDVRPLCGGIELVATSDARGAVGDADFVFTATGVEADSDLVKASWLKDDAVVCSLGSHREVDLDLLSSAWIVADDPAGLEMRRRDFQAHGAGWNRIAAGLSDVVAGRVPLPQPPQHIHLALIGLGVLDVAIGVHALENARRGGLGTELV